MKGALSIAIDPGPIEKASAEIVVVSCFETDRPLRGETGRIDWRLCGAVSELLQRGVLRGAAGEAALLPTFGRLRAPRVLLLGLGTLQRFTAVDVKAAARDAVLRLGLLRIQSAAFALPGHWTGRLPEGPCAGAVLRGAVSALEETAESLRLRLFVPAQAATRALGGVEAAIRALGEPDVAIQLIGVEPVSTLSARRPPASSRGAGPPIA
ncbi:MAG TPA: M17 family peptidase N-terminal domain-containing protein [Myxococcota bacterium]|jgi:hypothetical protein|nr:M17 family peptidase N-terminal domain-containing protein [Myxococcota bacterium]